MDVSISVDDGGNQHRSSRHPDDLKKELESIEFDGEPEVLDDLREEARETVESQKETLLDVDDKASKVLRLNVLLFAVLVSAFCIAAQWGAEVDGGAVDWGAFTNPYVVLVSLPSSCRQLSPRPRTWHPSWM